MTVEAASMSINADLDALPNPVTEDVDGDEKANSAVTKSTKRSVWPFRRRTKVGPTEDGHDGTDTEESVVNSGEASGFSRGRSPATKDGASAHASPSAAQDSSSASPAASDTPDTHSPAHIAPKQRSHTLRGWFGRRAATRDDVVAADPLPRAKSLSHISSDGGVRGGGDTTAQSSQETNAALGHDMTAPVPTNKGSSTWAWLRQKLHDKHQNDTDGSTTAPSRPTTPLQGAPVSPEVTVLPNNGLSAPNSCRGSVDESPFTKSIAAGKVKRSFWGRSKAPNPLPQDASNDAIVTLVQSAPGEDLGVEVEAQSHSTAGQIELAERPRGRHRKNHSISSLFFKSTEIDEGSNRGDVPAVASTPKVSALACFGVGAVAEDDDEELELDGLVGGPIGLINLGNTCFINSGLQCLRCTPHLLSALAAEALADPSTLPPPDPMHTFPVTSLLGSQGLGPGPDGAQKGSEQAQAVAGGTQGSSERPGAFASVSPMCGGNRAADTAPEPFGPGFDPAVLNECASSERLASSGPLPTSLKSSPEGSVRAGNAVASCSSHSNALAAMTDFMPSHAHARSMAARSSPPLRSSSEQAAVGSVSASSLPTAAGSTPPVGLGDAPPAAVIASASASSEHVAALSLSLHGPECIAHSRDQNSVQASGDLLAADSKLANDGAVEETEDVAPSNVAVDGSAMLSVKEAFVDAQPPQPQQEPATAQQQQQQQAPAREVATKAQVSESLVNVMVRLATSAPGADPVVPRTLHQKLSQNTLASDFCDGGQHDSQEMLRVLLDVVHEANDRVTEKPPYKPDSEDPAESPAAKAARMWSLEAAREASHITDAFRGQLHSRIVCAKCNGAFHTFEPFLDLSLSLHKGKGLSFFKGKALDKLEDCLRAFTDEEKLDGDEAFACPTCDTRCPATKALRVSRFPRCLVLHIKRFKMQTGRQHVKLASNVSFPLHGLRLAPFASELCAEPPENVIYDLYAVSNHRGSLTSGHYTAFCKLQTPDGIQKWHLFDDDTVTQVKEDAINTPNAYILFYVRRPLDKY